jgi:hypothetical protein
VSQPVSHLETSRPFAPPAHAPAPAHAPQHPPVPAAPVQPRPQAPAYVTNPAPPGLASSAESEELIVPIQLGKGGSHEIVLRIVLKLGG